MLKDYAFIFQPKYFLLDMSGVSFVDLQVCVALVNISKTMEQKNIKLILVGPQGKGDIWP